MLSHEHPVLLKDIDGHEISLQSLRGKWVFINYWATWCAPCLHELPELNRFYTQYKSKNIAVFGVNYEGLSLDAQRAFIKKYHINYPSLAEDPAITLRLGNIKAVPATFVLDPNGKLFATEYGEQTVKHLSDFLTIEVLSLGDVQQLAP